MRVRITGELVKVGIDRVELAMSGGDEIYEVMVPPAVAEELVGHTGERRTFHTREVYESQSQGASFVPRLLGFTTPEQRSLFELLTTVKGLGPRKALRSMNAPAGLIAQAIASGDTIFLKTMPEIGKRTADSIVLDLREKVGAIAAGNDALSGTTPAKPAKSASADQAVAALVNLGEQETSAKELVRRAIEAEPTLSDATPDAILASALAVRS